MFKRRDLRTDDANSLSEYLNADCVQITHGPCPHRAYGIEEK